MNAQRKMPLLTELKMSLPAFSTNMPRLTALGQARLHIGAREAGIFFKHVLDGIAGGEKFQNRLHRDARAANDGPAIADIRVNGNSVRHDFTVI